MHAQVGKPLPRVIPPPSKIQAGQNNLIFFRNRLSRLADEGDTLSVEFSKAFGLLLKKSLRTMWENVEETDEEGDRTQHDGEFLRYSRHR